MNIKRVHVQNGISSFLNPLMPTVSEDGYIRLTFVELQNFRLIHLISGLDDEAHKSICGASRSSISGYTEWLSDSTPALTMGWDWEMDFIDRRIQLRRVSVPRSNLMIQDADRSDLGYEKSILLQEVFVDGLDWQAAVHKQIGIRYR